MSPRNPQLDDIVALTLRLPGDTEEWAEDALQETEELVGWECERTDTELIVRTRIHGNCNAVANAASWLRDIEDALAEVGIDPMHFSLEASAVPDAK